MNFMLIYWRRQKEPERRKYPQRAAARMAPHLSSKSGDQAKPASSTCHCLLTGFILFENWKHFSYFDHWCSNRLPSSPCFLGSTALCLRAILTAGKFLVMHLYLISSVTRWENHCCGAYNPVQHLVPRTQILAQFGPPKKRVNFDICNRRHKWVYCVLTVSIWHT